MKIPIASDGYRFIIPLVIITVALALVDFGVWSLVWGELASKLVLTICFFKKTWVQILFHPKTHLGEFG